MKNDFEMVTHSFDESIVVYPISDVHFGALEHLSDEWLDCLIVGHTHKGTVTKPSKIVIDRKNDKVSMSHYVVVSMVSWLNYGGYALKKMLLPAHVADPQILKLHMNKKKRIEVNW